jgi:hypothetical protein
VIPRQAARSGAWPADRTLPPTMKQRILAEAHGGSPHSRSRSTAGVGLLVPAALPTAPSSASDTAPRRDAADHLAEPVEQEPAIHLPLPATATPRPARSPHCGPRRTPRVPRSTTARLSARPRTSRHPDTRRRPHTARQQRTAMQRLRAMQRQRARTTPLRAGTAHGTGALAPARSLSRLGLPREGGARPPTHPSARPSDPPLLRTALRAPTAVTTGALHPARPEPPTAQRPAAVHDTVHRTVHGTGLLTGRHHTPGARRPSHSTAGTAGTAGSRPRAAPGTAGTARRSRSGPLPTGRPPYSHPPGARNRRVTYCTRFIARSPAASAATPPDAAPEPDQQVHAPTTGPSPPITAPTTARALSCPSPPLRPPEPFPSTSQPHTADRPPTTLRPATLPTTAQVRLHRPATTRRHAAPSCSSPHRSAQHTARTPHGRHSARSCLILIRRSVRDPRGPCPRTPRTHPAHAL